MYTHQPTIKSRSFKQHEWYENSFPSHSHIVSAAYEIANKAHGEHRRDKKNQEIKYITHPIMVCKLLAAIGKDDELSVAIALLHDVLEDCEPYKSNPETLKQEFKSLLVKSGYVDASAENVSSYVFQHCLELRNDKSSEEDKRTYQVMHAHAMTDRSKLIKILDQTASVMDDIFIESNRPKDKIERFAMKALSVVKAAARGGTEDITRAARLFSESYGYLRNLHRLKDEESAIARKMFDPLECIRRVHKTPYISNHDPFFKPVQIEELLHPGMSLGGDNAQPAGCVAVNYAKDNKGAIVVSGYDCLIDRNPHEFSVNNRATWYLLGELESFEKGTLVEMGEARVLSKQLVRHYTIEPPVALKKFISSARAAENQVRASALENGLAEESIPKKPVLDNRFAYTLVQRENELAVHQIGS